MNSCDYYQELISRLVDGDLSREEHEALMEHMKNCSACNAMYAVFHDLSDILAEESEPLPEGLHENIMAGVRRSEMMKKNRRMRRFGLNTALTAAACAVLVLFAAVGFAPGKRAESVSIRTEEAASALMPSPVPEIAGTEDSPIEPAVTAAPVYTPTPAPVVTQAPAYSDYAAGGDRNTQYSAPQQSYTYQQTPAPVWTPAPVYAPTPAPTVAPAPAVIAPQAPVVNESAPAQFEAPAAPVQFETPAVTEAPVTAEAEETDIGLFSLFSGVTEIFNAAPEESQITAQGGEDLSTAMEEFSVGDSAVFSTAELPAPPAVPEARDVPDTPDGKSEKKSNEEKISVYGKTLRTQLLAMLGETEAALPEAELTRLVHVTLVPEDAYGSEEQLDIRIYGDFVYWQRTEADGSVKCCRADCALRDLDSFLASCRLVSPSPAPTVDPFSAAPEN